MYRRGTKGIWQITVAGVRQTSGTADKERAKWLERKLNTEAWDLQHGLVIPRWEQACMVWADANPVAAAKPANVRFEQWWKPHLVGKKLDAITAQLVNKILLENRQVSQTEPLGANATANQYAGFVARVIRHASNLKPQFVSYPVPLGRDRWLTVEEWRTLSGAMDQDLRDLCEFGLATGLREANCMFFDWAWFKEDWALIPAEVTKTRKPYAIPLNRTAQAVLQRRRAATIRHPRYAFMNSGKPWYRVAVVRAMWAAVEAAGIEAFTYHGFRHTFASLLAQRGVDDDKISRLGCWSVKTQSGHYSHLDVESLRPYANLIDQALTLVATCDEKSA